MLTEWLCYCLNLRLKLRQKMSVILISSRKMLIVFVLICAMVALNKAVVQVSENDTETNSHRENVTEPTSEDVAARHLCPGGWTHYHSRCFLYVSCAMSWTEAKQYCQYRSANLASVHEYPEYEALQKMIKAAAKKDQISWIGGSDMRKEDEWEWVDGSRFSYDFWCPNEPNDARGNEDCLLVNWKGNGCWNDFTCTDEYPFVCAK